MSEYRLAEKPALDALVSMRWQMLAPAKALAMRGEENRVILKPMLIDALRRLNGIGEADAEAIYNDLATLSDNEEWQRKLRGGYSRRLSGENRDSHIALIDFKDPSRNAFHVTNQFKVQATLPDAHFYGFTGTPIKSTDKDTYARFSVAGEGYLDKYGIDDAVRDGATVPILYEGRKTDWAINEAEIDILFDRWFVDLPDDRREELKRKGLAITYRNGFMVDLPHWAGQDADQLVSSELQQWLKQRARRDVKEIAADYGKRFGLVPRSIRVSDFAHGWGSCGPEGNVLINWHLIFAPKKVLEYVVVHELAHLRERSHGPEFWQLMRQLAPEFERSRSWLDRHQIDLIDPFCQIENN